jgi:hypothetical protein
MKIKLDIDVTPEEARAFLGLPDVKPMQKTLLEETEARLRSNLRAMDPEAIINTCMPATLKGFEQFQEILARAAAGRTKK